MTAAECYTTEVKLLNQAGREFVVKYYINPEGYWWNNEQMMCMTCQTFPAPWGLEAYNHNHLYEPIHSEYYCDTCVPGTNRSQERKMHTGKFSLRKGWP